MLCSSNCTNETFDKWLLRYAFVGPNRDALESQLGLLEYIKSTKSDKPFLLMFDEIQKTYDAPYAKSFHDVLKRISQETFSKWNIKVFLFILHVEETRELLLRVFMEISIQNSR